MKWEQEPLVKAGQLGIEGGEEFYSYPYHVPYLRQVKPENVEEISGPSCPYPYQDESEKRPAFSCGKRTGAEG